MKISAQNIGKKYHRQWVFRQFNAEFEGPIPYLITGPNGSGKSTLLRILWAQLPPSSGQVVHFVEGKKIEGDKVYIHVSIAAPYMELINEFTLEEILQFHFRFKKMSPGLDIEKILKMMEMYPHRNKKIGAFSSGMKQRTKLGLAFASQTAFLFLDEPCTNLDENGVAWYRHQLSNNKTERLIFIASNQKNEHPDRFQPISLGG